MTDGKKGLNRFCFREEDIRFCWSFAVPSKVFNTTLPVNPSVTNTSTLLVAKSLPSTFPTKFKELEFKSLKADFSSSLPLDSSSPLFKSPIFGDSMSKRA